MSNNHFGKLFGSMYQPCLCAIHDPAIPLLELYSREMCMCAYYEAWTRMFMGDKNWNVGESTCPSINSMDK